MRTGFVLAFLLGAPAMSEQSISKPPVEGACANRGRPGAFDADIQAAVLEVAPVWPLPASFVKAIIARESNFNPVAVSSAGAIGLMQVMPSNARRLGVTPEALWHSTTNILAGTRLLAVLLRHYQGDVISALVAYNARPRRRLAPLPDNAETPAYVRAVLHLWAAFERCDVQRLGAVPTKSLRRKERLFGARGTTPA
jgi:soluble lytic murein transglycosylase-like protein